MKKINTVPGSCRIGYDWRLIPELSVEWAKEQITAVCEKVKASMPGSDYTIHYLGRITPRWFRRIRTLSIRFLPMAKHLLAGEMEFSVSPGMDDQKYVVQKESWITASSTAPGGLPWPTSRMNTPVLKR